MFFFFFQAEDGIRDIGVTGVQTCALPISAAGAGATLRSSAIGDGGGSGRDDASKATENAMSDQSMEIGRASCRERVSISVVAVSLKKKKKTAQNESKYTACTRTGKCNAKY